MKEYKGKYDNADHSTLFTYYGILSQKVNLCVQKDGESLLCPFYPIRSGCTAVSILDYIHNSSFSFLVVETVLG